MDAALYISSDDIRNALNSLIHPTSDDRSFESLCALYLVDEICDHPDFPPTDRARQFAVYELLRQLIEEKLIHERALHNIQYTEDVKSVEVALERIQDDNLTESMSLIGWSLLDYCYIQVDLNISFERFAETIGLHERSLRRYRTRAIEHLHAELLSHEQAARKRLKERRLLSQLPLVLPQRLYGRTEEMSRVSAAIDNDFASTVVVTGAAGVGKTAFVQTIVQSMIKERKPLTIEFVCWIDEPQSVDDVLDRVWFAVGFENGEANLREWFMMYPAIIVVDNADDLVEDHSAMRRLFSELSPAQVIITLSSFVVLDRVSTNIVLHELAEQDALAYLDDLQQRGTFHVPDLTEAEQGAVLNIAGGNPYLIMMTAQLLNLGMVESSSSHEIISNLYNRVLDRLSTGSIRAWCAFVLCPVESIQLADLLTVWDDAINRDDVHALAVYHVIEPGNELETFRLTRSGRRFITQSYSQFKSHIEDLLAEMVTRHTSPFVFKVIDCVLGPQWLKVDAKLQSTLLDRLTSTQVMLGKEPVEELLEPSGGLMMQVSLPYAVSLRRRGRFTESLGVLDNLIRDTGMLGEFEAQATIQLEKAVLLRLIGEYELAVALFEDVQQAARRYESRAIEQRAALELAQVAIDRMEGNQALFWLESLQNAQNLPLRWHFLMAEAYLLEGQIDMAYQIAQDLIEQVEHDRSRLGRVQVLLGRCEMKRSNYTLADYHFKVALTYFDEQLDSIAYARALSNLGAVQTYLAAFDEARANLAKAHKHQQIMGDGLGLTTTIHNVETLRKFRNDVAN